MRRKTQIEEYQIKGNGFVVKTCEERMVYEDEEGYYVIGKKRTAKDLFERFWKEIRTARKKLAIFMRANE